MSNEDKTKSLFALRRENWDDYTSRILNQASRVTTVLADIIFEHTGKNAVWATVDIDSDSDLLFMTGMLTLVPGELIEVEGEPVVVSETIADQLNQLVRVAIPFYMLDLTDESEIKQELLQLQQTRLTADGEIESEEDLSDALTSPIDHINDKFDLTSLTDEQRLSVVTTPINGTKH